MAAGIGSVEIDFGTFPGSNEASVAVTGQTEITDASKAEAYIMAERKDDRPKSRKVKRELAERIIDTAGFTGLLGSGVPAPVFRAVAAAVDAPRPDPALYEAIALALIRAADEADEEDAIVFLLLAA